MIIAIFWMKSVQSKEQIGFINRQPTQIRLLHIQNNVQSKCFVMKQKWTMSTRRFFITSHIAVRVKVFNGVREVPP
jgi:hypothetical protein